MAVHARPPSRERDASQLAPDFAERLEGALVSADRERRRRMWYARGRRLLPIILLVGPIVAWRLMISTPTGLHVYIDALSWLAFILDVGVHVDASILGFLGLSALPTLAGALLFAMVTLTLLWTDGSRK